MDMVHSGMLGSLSNYIGNQSNYGYGATYWSYGREDNGSLALTFLATDEALLEWGMCSVATGHIGFFFDNYVDIHSGHIAAYTWKSDGSDGGEGDSVSDVGRIIHIFIRATKLCGHGDSIHRQMLDEWSAEYTPYAEALGRRLLRLRVASATDTPKPPTGCAGLVNGAPEHDWGGVTDKFFFNNNAWTLRGIEALSKFLLSDSNQYRNKTLGKILQADGKVFRPQLVGCVEACTEMSKSGAEVAFVPPYASLNATAYDTMTDSREASYSNFRFYPETLLADVLPRDVEQMMLRYHNTHNGMRSLSCCIAGSH